MLKQKAIYVLGKDGVDKLNEFLNNGWQVVDMCAMPGDNSWPRCLVIIYKNDEEKI